MVSIMPLEKIALYTSVPENNNNINAALTLGRTASTACVHLAIGIAKKQGKLTFLAAVLLPEWQKEFGI